MTKEIDELVSELLGLIEKATNEPWEQAGEFVSAKKLHGSVTEIINVATCERPEDAAYLVSTQPANMTKLLDCVTSQAARIRGLQAGADALIKVHARWNVGEATEEEYLDAINAITPRRHSTGRR